MSASSASPARKPIHDALDKTPPWLKDQGVAAHEWLLALQAHYDSFKNLAPKRASGINENGQTDAWRLAMVLAPAALRQGKRNSLLCEREKIDGPKGALLCTVEIFECPKCGERGLKAEHCDAAGRWVAYRPMTPTDAAELADILPENASRGLRVLEDAGIVRRTGASAPGKRRLWIAVKPDPRIPLDVISPDNVAFSSPPKLSAKLDKRIITLNQLPRKKIFGTVTHWEFQVDPELIADEKYCAAVAAEIEACAGRSQELLAQAKAESDARLRALSERWRTNGDDIGPDNQATEALTGPVISTEGQNVIPVISTEDPLYKERARAVVSSISSKTPEHCSIPEESRSIDRSSLPGPAKRTPGQELTQFLEEFASVIGRPPSPHQIKSVLDRLAGRSVDELKRRYEFFREHRRLEVTGYGIFIRMAEECGQPLPFRKAERASQEFQESLAIIERAKQAEKEERKK